VLKIQQSEQVSVKTLRSSKGSRSRTWTWPRYPSSQETSGVGEGEVYGQRGYPQLAMTAPY